MRTIKFLGLAVAVAAAAVPALGQGTLQPGAFPGVDRLARIEANQLAHRRQMRQLQGQRLGRMQMNGRFGQARGLRGGFAGRNALRAGDGRGWGRGFAAAPGSGFRAGARAGMQAGVRAGVRAGARAGFRAGLRADRLANATPEQKAFVEQLRAQRQTVHAQVLEGKLTREQARTQMQQWAREHRPKK